jgi:hypothetical protein
MCAGAGYEVMSGGLSLRAGGVLYPAISINRMPL